MSKQKMTIVHLVDYFHPLMGYQENNLAKLQVESGNKVFIITSDRMTPWYNVRNDTIAKGDAELAEKGVFVKRLPVLFEYSHRIWLKGLKSAINDINPDWVHVHGFFTLNAMRVSLIKKNLDFKLLVDDHMLYIAVTNVYAKIVYPFFKTVVAPFIRKNTDVFVAVAEETKTFMEDKYGVKEIINVIPLGVDTGGIKDPEKDRISLRNEFGFKKEDKVLIYTGKMDHYKDPKKALKAAFKVWGKGVDFKFILIGGGDKSYIESLKGLAANSKYGENIIIHSAVNSDDLKRYFNMADIAVWPCQSSMSAFEAMAYGCPVILSYSVENVQRVSKGCGVIYQNDSSENNLEGWIFKLLLDDELSVRMREKGYVVTKDIDWRKINRKFLELMA